LNEWFGNGRQRNIGIVTGRLSGLVVLDADSPEALAWMRAHLPPTYAGTQTTKGQHWYFRHPGSRVRNKVRIRTEDPAIKIDVRADGGYVVAPGSLHVSGARYERIGPWPPFDCLPVFDPAWIDPATDPGADEDAGDAPDAAPLFTAPADREALRRRARAYLEAMGPAIEGQGGDAHTLRAAFALRDFGLSEGDAFEVLHDWNQACEPPWSEGELREKIANAWKYAERPAGTKVVDRPRPINGTPMAGAGARAERVAADTVSDGAAVTFARTDLGNAEAFASATRDRLRFDHRHGRWLLFEGHRWRPDVDAAVWRLLTATTRRRLHAALELNDEADRRAAVKWALSSEARPKLEAALALGARLAPLADAGDAWDADPFLLGVENGVVDLRTGVLRPGRPEDRITRACAAAFDPAAPAPRWERFIREVLCQFDDDGTIDEARTAGVVGFLHRALGYSLTGDTSEQALWLLHGGGSNGKTILLETIADVLGDYAYAAPFSTFVYQPNPGGIPNDLAALEGRRFVICTEATDGVRLNETRLKAFSGGDTMAARFMRAEFFTLKPAGKVWLAFNRKPIVRDDSNGFWRRVRMVPFLRTFEKNGSLKAALLAERAGILRWLVEGCRAWQRDGLGLPDAVRDATDGYQAESDPIREFLETVCDTSDRLAETPAADLYTSYCEWAEVVKLADRERLTRHAFGRLATERFKRRRSARGRWYVGLRVRQRSEWSRDEDEA
jgi:putative DNA primase/helicase